MLEFARTIVQTLIMILEPEPEPAPEPVRARVSPVKNSRSWILSLPCAEVPPGSTEHVTERVTVASFSPERILSALSDDDGLFLTSLLVNGQHFVSTAPVPLRTFALGTHFSGQNLPNLKEDDVIIASVRNDSDKPKRFAFSIIGRIPQVN